MTAPNTFVGALRDVVGPTHVLVDADMVAGYIRDWTGRWTGQTQAVVRPGSVEEVQQVVRICHEFGTSVVAQGGNTGLVGGSIPHRGEVVLSVRRLDWLGPVDPQSREVTAGAGVTIAALQGYSRDAGLEYGVDLASRESATVGGTIATNAGGIKVVAHGDTRRQVLGLEVVLADGTLATHLDGLAKESMGPDPMGLMVGSEGTLGIITAARLRLVPPAHGEPVVTLVAVARLSEGLQLLTPGTRAIEFFDQACLDAVIEHRGLSRPFSTDFPFYILIESTELPDVPKGTPAVVDRSLWAYREAITETLNQLGVPVKLDVAVTSGRVDQLAAGIHELGLDGDLYLFGHLAEGNFHVNLVGSPEPAKAFDQVLEIVVELDGAIASEHGIGVAKAGWWRRSADPALLAVHRRIKEALDPDRILNPEVFWGG